MLLDRPGLLPPWAQRLLSCSWQQSVERHSDVQSAEERLSAPPYGQPHQPPPPQLREHRGVEVQTAVEWGGAAL